MGEMSESEWSSVIVAQGGSIRLPTTFSIWTTLHERQLVSKI